MVPTFSYSKLRQTETPELREARDFFAEPSWAALNIAFVYPKPSWAASNTAFV